MWCLVCGVWCVVCGVWCVAFGEWFVVCGAWGGVCGAWCVVRGVSGAALALRCGGFNPCGGAIIQGFVVLGYLV